MTLEDFKAIPHIKSEIELIKQRIEKYSTSKFVGDYAKDYSTGQERVITIRGYASIDTDKVARISALLEKRKNELNDKILEAELFIDSIPDSKIRSLLTLRYLEGYSWSYAARKLYKKMTEDSARKAVARFFNNV